MTNNPMSKIILSVIASSASWRSEAICPAWVILSEVERSHNQMYNEIPRQARDDTAVSDCHVVRRPPTGGGGLLAMTRLVIVSLGFH